MIKLNNKNQDISLEASSALQEVLKAIAESEDNKLYF